MEELTKLYLQNGRWFYTRHDILRKLGVKPDQVLTYDQQWVALTANAQVVVDIIERKRALGESDMPDTSALQCLIATVKDPDPTTDHLEFNP